MTQTDLLGLSGELDYIVRDLSFLAQHYAQFHPANVGDVSQVLSRDVSGQLLSRFNETLSNWYELSRLDEMASIRKDGRTGYRTQGIKDEGFYRAISPIAGRMLLITRTGSQIPAIAHSIEHGDGGKLLNIIQVDDSARRIRIVYGNVEHGSIPSIETHVHILANAISIGEGHQNPGVVHAHPYHLVLLGRHPKICGDFCGFNAVIYTQVEGLNRNYQDLIGIVPYCESGTEALVVSSLIPLKKHRMVLWMNHGFVAREANVRGAYTLISYAEDCARAAMCPFGKAA